MLNNYVYCIQEGNVGYVKVGVAKNVEQRCSDMQTGNSKILRIQVKLGPYGRKQAMSIERWLHGYFKRKDWHVRGEWFIPQCLDHIPAALAKLAEKRKK